MRWPQYLISALRAMVRPGRDQLSDVVEVDETYTWGGAGQTRPWDGGQSTGNCCGTRREKTYRSNPASMGQGHLGKVLGTGGRASRGFTGRIVRTDDWKGYGRAKPAGSSTTSSPGGGALKCEEGAPEGMPDGQEGQRAWGTASDSAAPSGSMRHWATAPVRSTSGRRGVPPRLSPASST